MTKSRTVQDYQGCTDSSKVLGVNYRKTIFNPKKVLKFFKLINPVQIYQSGDAT